MAADPGVGGHGPVFHGWRIVAALAVTQTVGYGTLYYAFAVLLQPMATTLHASTTTVTGALTASILAGAVMAVPVGRWLDRHGGRALMTVGSIAATGLLLAWSQVRTVAQLYAILIGVGLASAMVLYEPAFAVVVSWFDPARRAKALLAITIVAGFASAIFLPLTGALVTRYGWPHTLLILAALHGIVTVPLHVLVVRRAPRSTHAARHRSAADRAAVVRAALRDTRFWVLGVAFVAEGAAMTAMTVHLVGFLTSRGHPVTFAATVAGLLGVLSVTGRLVLTGAQRRIRITTVVAAIFTVQAVAALALLAAGGSRIGAVAGVVAFGLGFGISSLATPALLAGRYGTVAYATIAGTLTVPITLARAGAPLGAAALLATGGYTPVLTAIAIACLIAATGIVTRAATPSPVPVAPDGWVSDGART
ncbi:MFS transporter [Dactylosporangium matsuzakiense]|uniref:MFS transporter n=1 Tax=Dactylosporangium matsuzakiense TaxID=53360 RepID=A0A9W6NNZ1_9ACTN|nr:MFS transporter [Dactylosporangium matsuzakiense]